jgi:thymidylate synthase
MAPIFTLQIVYQRDSNVMYFELFDSSRPVGLQSLFHRKLILDMVEAAREWVLSKHYVGPKVVTPRNITFTIQASKDWDELKIDAPMWNKDLALAMLSDTKDGTNAKAIDYEMAEFKFRGNTGEEIDVMKWQINRLKKQGEISPETVVIA